MRQQREPNGGRAGRPLSQGGRDALVPRGDALASGRMQWLIPALFVLWALPRVADAVNSPPGETEGAWLRHPMGIIGHDIEGAELPEGFSLSELHTVNDAVHGETTCYVLRVGEHTLGSITLAMRGGNGLVFQQCRYNKCGLGEYCPYTQRGQECLCGGVWGWFVATQEDRSRRNLEGLGGFSNPVPCGAKVAYWSSRDLPDHETDSEYFAYVTDIDSGTVLRKAFVGQAWIGTDNEFHIAYPRWRPDCSEVWFRDARYFQPVTFTFGGDGDAATGPVRGQE